MFEPEVEARFRRIKDAQIVAAELLHRFENETRENVRHMSAVMGAIAQWMESSEERLRRTDTRGDEFEAKLNAVIDIVADLSRENREALRAAQEARHVAEEATRAAQESRHTAEEATRAAQESRQTAEEATRAAQESRHTAEEATRAALESRHTAEEATRAAQEGRTLAQEALQAARDAAASVDRLSQTVDRLSQTVDRYLKARTNGGTN